MSLLFSRACEYAIQAVIYISKQPPNKLTLIREIADELDIPAPFLAKILQTLSRNGLLISYKGRGGGFTLAKSPKEITLMEIITLIDGPNLLNKCVIGLPNCSDDNQCPLHKSWKKIRDDIKDMLTNCSINELLKEAKKTKKM